MATEAMVAVTQWRLQAHITILHDKNSNGKGDGHNYNNDNDDDNNNINNNDNEGTAAMVTTVVVVKAMMIKTVAVTVKHAAAITPAIIFFGVGRPQGVIFLAKFNSHISFYVSSVCTGLL